MDPFTFGFLDELEKLGAPPVLVGLGVKKALQYGAKKLLTSAAEGAVSNIGSDVMSRAFSRPQPAPTGVSQGVQ